MSLHSPTWPTSSLAALTEAAAAINSTLELKAVLETIARLACSVTRAETSSVFTLDTARSKLRVQAATGHWRDALVGRDFQSNLGIPGQIVRTHQPILLRNARDSAKFNKQIDESTSTPTRSIVGAPMFHRAEVIGVIVAANRRDQTYFTEEDVKLLQVFATLATTAIQNAQTHETLQRRFDGLRDSVMKQPSIIGESAPWLQAMELCDRVAGSNATVLLTGETGTGKELLARYIHNTSRRRDHAFVAVNCAALAETLLESELFGHEKGSFTGAHKQRLGWFEVASGGTLFLDEIGEVSRAVQAKLLRVLQEKRIVRVGGTEPVVCDTRIIAATNRNLRNMMIDGLFREDLFYRLSVFPIQLPRLRDRPEDLALLTKYFLEKSAREFNIPELIIAPATLETLRHYDWPGNIRELQNVVERSVLMSDGPALLPSHLPSDIQASGNGQEMPSDSSTLWGQERTLIIQALKNNRWNQSKAAEELGVTRYHIRHRIKKYRIEKPPEASTDSPEYR